MEVFLPLVQNLFEVLGVQATANNGDVVGLLILLASLAAAGFQVGKKAPTQKPEVLETKIEPASRVQLPQTVPAPEAKPEPKKEVLSFAQKLMKGLTRSREDVWGKMSTLFSGRKMDQSLIDEIEELLFSADLGPKVVGEILEMLEGAAKKEELSERQFKEKLFTYLRDKMEPIQLAQQTSLYQPITGGQAAPKVIMIVGVNGAGKTTTIGKIATKLTRAGSKVVVGACDTFRAAAVDQLQVWCDRAGATMIRAKEGSNPSGVGFEALQEAIRLKADYCLLDTAGRLHTKENLMEELKKSKMVLKKLDQNAPDEILLVIDAITGQNALRQAQEFHKTLDLTGLIFTKCDGSSKAGSAISIVSELAVPLTYIGVGESVDDLDVFALDAYLSALTAYAPEGTEAPVH